MTPVFAFKIVAVLAFALLLLRAASHFIARSASLRQAADIQAAHEARTRAITNRMSETGMLKANALQIRGAQPTTAEPSNQSLESRYRSLDETVPAANIEPVWDSCDEDFYHDAAIGETRR